MLLSVSGCSPSLLQLGQPQNIKENKILFQDNFSDPSSGWTTTNQKDLIVGYDDGHFRMWINKPNLVFWSLANLRFSDALIEVDTARFSGPVDNSIGIVCRYTDPGNFYGFLISSDGYYGITKREEGKFTIIGMDEMKYSKIINEDDSINHLQANCIGNSLQLFVNGKKLAEATDSSFTTGDVGVMAGSYTQPDVDVIFDNFIVSSP